jgi:hypothetical protein
MTKNLWTPLLFVLGAVACLAATPSALADGLNGGTGPVLDDPPLTVGADWFATMDTPPAFFWGSGDNALNLEGPYTFNAASPVRLDVTDDFSSGDRFEVFDFNVSIGLTSLSPGGGGGEVGPEAAFNGAVFSRGSFFLGPGAHSITIAAILNPFNGGRGYLRAVPIPEPNSIAMGALALLSIRFAGRRIRLGASGALRA